MLLLDCARADDEADDVSVAIDAVSKASKLFRDERRIVGGLRRAWAEPLEGVCDLRAERRHVAEREARSDHRDELLIDEACGLVHERDRIVGPSGPVVAARPNLVEHDADFAKASFGENRCACQSHRAKAIHPPICFRTSATPIASAWLRALSRADLCRSRFA